MKKFIVMFSILAVFASLSSQAQDLRSNKIFQTDSNRPAVLTEQILFSTNNPGNRHNNIYAMNSDGTNKHLIVSSRYDSDIAARSSSDGRQVVFNRRQSGKLAIFVSDISNDIFATSLTTENLYFQNPVFSPDGNKIMFSRCLSDSPASCDLWTMNTDGNNKIPVPLVNSNDGEDYPSWSANGQKIIFSRFFAENRTAGIFQANTDGTGLQQLTVPSSAGVRDINPRFSPDGSKILFSRSSQDFPSESSSEIFVMNADGSNQVRLTNNSAYDGKPVWSPNGSKIAFSSDRDTGTDWEIYTMSNDGSSVSRITFNNDSDTVSDWASIIVPRRTAFDFNGDGKADLSFFRPSNGCWYTYDLYTSLITVLAFGLSTDKLVPADYDGDGKTDIAVNRNGNWYIQQSAAGFMAVPFGYGDDIPVPADYDGDGKADVAVFRPANGYWYIQQSTGGFTGFAFGQNGDKPVAADYDGDGKADVAVNRAGIWYIQRSQSGFFAIQFGLSTDKLVPADYDGDGKTDIAVFRPTNSTWYLQQSSAGYTGIAQGFETDALVAADYNGDGKADIATYRSGSWYFNGVIPSLSGEFGTSTDLPIPSAFVR